MLLALFLYILDIFIKKEVFCLKKYNKGATAERELIHRLYNNGFSVARVAGSGSSTLPCPDLLAFNSKKKFAFECKAHNSKYLNISHEQIDSMQDWANNAKIDFFVGWKIPRKGWLFLKKPNFKKNKKNYSISLTDAKKKGLSFNVLIGIQKRLVK